MYYFNSLDFHLWNQGFRTLSFEFFNLRCFTWTFIVLKRKKYWKRKNKLTKKTNNKKKICSSRIVKLKWRKHPNFNNLILPKYQRKTFPIKVFSFSSYLIPIFFSKYLIPIKPFCYWIRKNIFLHHYMERLFYSNIEHVSLYESKAYLTMLLLIIFFNILTVYIFKRVYLLPPPLLMSIKSQYKHLSKEIKYSLTNQSCHFSLHSSYWLGPANPETHLVSKIIISKNFAVT